MKLTNGTESYSCTEIFYNTDRQNTTDDFTMLKQRVIDQHQHQQHNNITPSSSNNDINTRMITKPEILIENRSLTSSSSSTSSSYSTTSLTSDFCSTSPTNSTTGSVSSIETDDLCSNLNSIQLTKNQSSPNNQAQKPQQQTTLPSTSTSQQTQPESKLNYLKFYQIKEKIRSGGFGVVFKGVRRIDNLPIAVKIIRKDKICLWSDVSWIFEI